MTQTESRTRVRNLLDQTDSTDTQFSDTNLIDYAVSEGRRLFARILPQEMLPNLKTISNLTLANGYAAYPSDFLRIVKDGEHLVDSIQAREIPVSERWRLKFISDNNLVKGGTTDKYWFSHRAGVNVYPKDAKTFTIQYIKVPGVLAAGDNTDLTDDVEDLTISFAFYRCMNTQRGDRDIANQVMKEHGIFIKEAKE